MFDTLLSPAFAPFTLSLMLLFALVLLEVVFMLTGLSLTGGGGDIDLDVVDIPDFGDLADLGVDISLSDAADYTIADVADTDMMDGIDSDVGALAWLGMGKVPFVIWLGSILFGFGVAGIVLQSIVPLTAFLASIPAGVAGIWFAKTFSAGISAVLPKSETTATDVKRFGGYRGEVTQGVARRGHPAEVRVIDRFGNMHYLRAEPVCDDEKIAQGTNVVIVRNIRTKQMRILAIG